MGVQQMEPELPSDAVGRRVSSGGERATVRFVGPVPPSTGPWLGVEWDNPDRGKHDGSHEGVQYFSCRNPKGGSFIRPAKVTFGVDFLTAVQQVYQMDSEEVMSEEIAVSSRKLKWVPITERSFESLPTVLLNRSDVNGPGADGDIRKTTPNVQYLDLCGTLLSCWEDVAAICQQLDRLEGLQLSFNRLRLPSDPWAHRQAFTNVTVLALNSCRLTWPQWFVVDELAKLPSLVQLSCRGNQLVSSDGNPRTASQMLIAKLGHLDVLNNSEITHEDRRGAELDYIKMFGEEWLKAGGRSQPNSHFCQQHPRYQTLIDKYGAPEEGELKKPQPFALKNQLLKITFVFPDDADRTPIEKKLPATMEVQKVKGLLYRLLKVPTADLRLTYTTPKKLGTEFEIDSDLKTLQFYSIEDGDQVLVRWS
ncbi:tubulin-specific chaperone E isoform 2-T2 [Pholidichthys leucotaenia]